MHEIKCTGRVQVVSSFFSRENATRLFYRSFGMIKPDHLFGVCSAEKSLDVLFEEMKFLMKTALL
jgi:hypothetical protein